MAKKSKGTGKRKRGNRKGFLKNVFGDNRLPAIQLSPEEQIGYVQKVLPSEQLMDMNDAKLQFVTFNRNESFIVQTYEAHNIYISNGNVVAILKPEAVPAVKKFDLLPNPDKEVVDDGTEDDDST